MSIKDADVLIKAPRSEYLISADGDFNGDGFDDLAIAVGVSTSFWVGIVFGNSSIPALTLPDQANFIISLNNTDKIEEIEFLDLNGDGLDDLLMGASNPDFSNSFIYAVFGSSVPPVSLDWKTQPPAPDLLIQFPRQVNQMRLEKCDFDGDGKEDFLTQIQSNYFLFFGKDSYPTSNVRIDDPVLASKFSGGLLGSNNLFMASNINNDGRSDLIMHDGSLFRVFFGTTTFVAERNFSTQTGDFQFSIVDSVSYFYPQASGDCTGDEIDELIFTADAQAGPSILLDGAVFTSAISPVELRTDIPNSYIRVFDESYSKSIASLSDFDGDEKSDLFLIKWNFGLKVYLARDFLFQSSSYSSTIDFYSSKNTTVGDMNGDGKSDLIVLSYANEYLGIIYGYDPLDNPTLQAKAAPALPKIQLTSDVEGDPVEMLLSGDFVDPIKDKWVPFNRVVPLTLTSAAGEKRIMAVFRNSFKRESEMAETTVTLAPGAPGLEMVNNVLSAGKDGARVDCHLDNAAHVTATILDQTGSEIDQVFDGEYGAGIWPLEWDGTNESGRAVGPGVYYMSIEVDGHAEKKKILVQN